MKIKIIEAGDHGPTGKLADAEIHFDQAEGPALDGLKLIGFSIWERRTGGRNVTFPARSYTVNGDRRTFALLRPTENTAAQDALRDAILDAYNEADTVEPNPAAPWPAIPDGQPGPLAELEPAGVDLMRLAPGGDLAAPGTPIPTAAPRVFPTSPYPTSASVAASRKATPCAPDLFSF